MEYECTCGRRFEAEYENVEDYYYDDYDREQYTAVWLETCPCCGRKYIIKEYYTRTDVEIEGVE